jgi:ABC-type transporter Mla subunit MlaD
MTGEEMERAIDFLLRSQATLEGRIEQVNTNLGARIEELAGTVGELTGRVGELAESVTELNGVLRMQADSQSQFNQTLTTAVTALAEAQAKTEAKVERLAGMVERLAGGQDAP